MLLSGAAAGLSLNACAHDGHFAHAAECIEYRDATNREHLDVLNNQKWCSFVWAQVYGGGDIPIVGGKIIAQPSHGKTRVVQREKASSYQYLPDPGYSGPDTFTIETTWGAFWRYPIEVQVKAPPAS